MSKSFVADRRISDHAAAQKAAYESRRSLVTPKIRTHSLASQGTPFCSDRRERVWIWPKARIQRPAETDDGKYSFPGELAMQAASLRAAEISHTLSSAHPAPRALQSVRKPSKPDQPLVPLKAVDERGTNWNVPRVFILQRHPSESRSLKSDTDRILPIITAHAVSPCNTPCLSARIMTDLRIIRTATTVTGSILHLFTHLAHPSGGSNRSPGRPALPRRVCADHIPKYNCLYQDTQEQRRNSPKPNFHSSRLTRHHSPVRAPPSPDAILQSRSTASRRHTSQARAIPLTTESCMRPAQRLSVATDSSTFRKPRNHYFRSIR